MSVTKRGEGGLSVPDLLRVVRSIEGMHRRLFTLVKERVVKRTLNGIEKVNIQ